MNKQTQAICNDMGTLAEDARALMAATADVLYVEAVNSRGTTKAGVRALSIASGEQRFEFSTGKAKPMDGDRGVFGSYHGSYDGTFSAHVADGRIYIVTFTEGSGYDHSIATDSVDATTGAAGPHQTIKADSGSLIPDFGPVTWISAPIEMLPHWSLPPVCTVQP